MLCQIHMALFVQWNTKVEILKTVSMHLEGMWTIAFKFQKVCASTKVLNKLQVFCSHLIALKKKKTFNSLFTESSSAVIC